MDTGTISDLERLRAAFTELRRHGYGADVDFGLAVCCGTCAGAEVERGPKGYVVFNRQTYGLAFWGAARAQPTPALIEAEIADAMPWLVPGLDGEAAALAVRTDLSPPERETLAAELRRAWADDGNGALLAEALADEREHRWHTLREPLSLGWGTDGSDGTDEMVGIIRAAGLTVRSPDEAGGIIEVLPTDGPHPPARPWPGRADGTEPRPGVSADRAWRLADWVARKAMPAGLFAKQAARADSDFPVPAADIDRWRLLPPVRAAADLEPLVKPPFEPVVTPEDKLLRAMFGPHGPTDDEVGDAFRRSGLDAVVKAVRRSPMDYRSRRHVEFCAWRAAEALAHTAAAADHVRADLTATDGWEAIDIIKP